MNPKIEEDELNRISAGTDEIVPSSGFVVSVMDAVRQEAAAPAPIPFPWKWAMPGLIASVGLAVFFIAAFAHAGTLSGYNAAAALRAVDLSSILPQSFEGVSIRLGIEWSVLGLLVSFVAVWLSMRISTSRE